MSLEGESLNVSAQGARGGRGGRDGCGGRSGRGSTSTSAQVVTAVAADVATADQMALSSDELGVVYGRLCNSASPVLTLADVGDITGRNDAPESTIGGETTCIVCMAHPKTHLAAPCGHQCACGPCAQRMQHCPYGRAPVQLWVQQRMV